MSIETAVLAVVVFGAAALAIFISFVLAKCEDEARRMVKDGRQLHYGDGNESGWRTQDEWPCADQPLEEPHDYQRRVETWYGGQAPAAISSKPKEASGIRSA
jgi:hypothetical protein